MKIALIAAMGIAALAALFAVQNAQQTQVSFMGWYFEAPLVMLLLLTFAAGALTAFLAMLPASLRKTMELSRLKADSRRTQVAKDAAPQPDNTDGGTPSP